VRTNAPAKLRQRLWHDNSPNQLHGSLNCTHTLGGKAAVSFSRLLDRFATRDLNHTSITEEYTIRIRLFKVCLETVKIIFCNDIFGKSFSL